MLDKSKPYRQMQTRYLGRHIIQDGRYYRLNGEEIPKPKHIPEQPEEKALRLREEKMERLKKVPVKKKAKSKKKGK